MNTNRKKIALFTSKEETEKQIWDILGSVYDPEIPVLSILDLGIVRDVNVKDETC